MATPAVSVLMPTFEQARTLPRAVDSLRAQTLDDWELVIVDDGSQDDTPAVVASLLADPRIRYHRLARNTGLGAALNTATAHAAAPLIAYLPSDDVVYRDHLADLQAALEAAPDAMLAFSGVRHGYNRFADGRIADKCLQLVQVMHRRAPEHWTERAVLTTDDLDRMLFGRLGPQVATGRVTCEWVDHPGQRHKIVQEPKGGINTYRRRYRVAEPLIFHTTTGHRIDEAARFARYRARTIEPAADGLNILLVGELAYNPERVLALAEAGHRLFGLWMNKPYWYNWVGPLPFGHVEDLPADDWVAAAQAKGIDVIYALLNWQAVPFAARVMRENPGIPFVWHFKEGPFICLEHGCFDDLLDLTQHSDGRIYSSAEMQVWAETVQPHILGGPALVLDGDLPKREGVAGTRSAKLSDADGEIHTVVPGRPIGLHPETVAELAAQSIHLHFYGEFTHGQWAAWIERTKGLAGRFIHLHSNVDQENWVAEFSKYDAGWLHFIASHNHGEMRRANWDDLNMPARVATLAAAGLPMLQRRNTGHVVATQTLLDGLGLVFDDMADLGAQLRDTPRVRAIGEAVWQARDRFTFDHHVPRLTEFFRDVIATRLPR